MKQIRFLQWIGLMILLVTAVACGGKKTDSQSATSLLTEEQAAEMAENALQAFNDGNYAGWSRDWSDTMKGAIKEADFLAYRQQVKAALGEYQSIESITLTPGNNKGYVRWVVVTQFENGRMQFSFGFAEDGRLIEGVFPELLS